MQTSSQKIVLLATGGTIAGQSAKPGDDQHYQAAQLRIADLVAAVPQLQGLELQPEQLAQIDSKDMSFTIWQALHQRVQQCLEDPQVAGVVITHGTDTMEETAYFLYRTLSPAKPVVLTGAMRPANSPHADGPANLAAAVQLALNPLQPPGVWVQMAGRTLHPLGVTKAHPRDDRAFEEWGVDHAAPSSSSSLASLASPLAPLALSTPSVASWPWVEIVHSQAGARPETILALLHAGVKGLILSCTGNGTWHADLDAALAKAQAQGVWVWRSTRCPLGVLQGTGLASEALPAEAYPACPLSTTKSRIEMMLRLMTTG